MQSLLLSSETRVITQSSLDGAIKLGLTNTRQIVDVVINLKEADFYKTMKSEKKPGLYQDVYKTKVIERNAYIKLQLSKKHKAVVISFKPDSSRGEI